MAAFRLLFRTTGTSGWLPPSRWVLHQRYSAAAGLGKLSPDAVTDADVVELNQEFRDFFGEPRGGGAEMTATEGLEDPLLMARADATDSSMAGARSDTEAVGRKGQIGERSMQGEQLTHVDAEGRAAMVDVGHKAETMRVATASGTVLLGEQAFGMVKANQLKKGDVLSVSQLAGIMGAKATAQLIPLCHNIFLSSVDVKLSLDSTAHAVRIETTAKTVGATGVEMEALTATSVAALTVYDMCKAVSKEIEITNVRLDHKSGGKSGEYTRQK
mmetsp:Transcript_36576/g.65450  ORF Transcript_36576/g.65450 Transcript_36576/m.65450 type:complete len:272 (-) Transcript_36576:39-854(-)|eukprot:CAMPEP_0177763652 /NCGR_PEP_ID=MMETSP0491_2-20121128/6982_1 /TAXON_ID=63592 /ORGANISM="Tetraselmis chuii, Strain PLY429" /LENGTH=271 /DNA_ID=CAMNT_0019279767 /DNA_START=40 /DNA_END=855 /DNA_ORIENTATION=-